MAQIGSDISFAKNLLKSGKCVAIPTETVYGLAADAFNEKAVASIFSIKNRPKFDPLIVHLFDTKNLDEIAIEIPDIFKILYQKFSPGPLTFILKKNPNLPDLVTAGNPTVAVRFPAHLLTRELLEKSRLALAAPSANPFGFVSPTTAQHVENQLGKKIEYILDGGSCTVGIESTIIDLSSKNPKILRLGGLAKEEIEKVTGRLETQTSSSRPNAPGMLSSHYSPGKKLVIGNIKELASKYSDKNVAVLSFQNEYSEIPKSHQKILSKKGDLNEAAANLFSALRELGESDAEIILAEKFPEEGLGRAINDRLLRASR